MPLSAVSVVDLWASPSELSVLIHKVGIEYQPSLPPKPPVKTKWENPVLCNDISVIENPFILYLLSIHFASQTDHNI